MVVTAPRNDPQKLTDNYNDGIGDALIKKSMKTFSSPAFFEWNKDSVDKLFNYQGEGK